VVRVDGSPHDRRARGDGSDAVEMPSSAAHGDDARISTKNPATKVVPRGKVFGSPSISFTSSPSSFTSPSISFLCEVKEEEAPVKEITSNTIEEIDEVKEEEDEVKEEEARSSWMLGEVKVIEGAVISFEAQVKEEEAQG
jgi:hypothetical protein